MNVLKRVGYCILAVLIAAAIYGWSLWYYGGLSQDGAASNAPVYTGVRLLVASAPKPP